MNLNQTNTSASIAAANVHLNFPVVGIGASAGGLEAFKRVVRALPENSGMAFVFVQHLNPAHESILPELLQKVTSLPVLEIRNITKIEPDHIYIVPENKLLKANGDLLQLLPRPAPVKNKLSMPIDEFFTSLAKVHQSNAVGIILSGMASDGTEGLKAIKENGGITFAQDAESADYDSMPHSAAMAGVVDFILPPEEIPKKLLEVMHIAASTPEMLFNIKEEEIFRQILALLRNRKGTDFTYYKQSTVRRRIFRRMAFSKNEQAADYLTFLRSNVAEQDLLYQDLLIPVTTFFRDPHTFENLYKLELPQLIKNKKGTDPIRIWVAACSTGEEAYSLAMCMHELTNGQTDKVVIFATDLSEPAIAKARAGIYSKAQMDGVSAQRQQKYFTLIKGQYHVKKNIRDLCVFAVHNFLKDPPFGKMDLISCRNVLIYMEPYLQKKAFSTFHYALKNEGKLLLGKSETVGIRSALFAPVLKQEKLYSRKNVAGKLMYPATQRNEQDFRDLNISIAPKADDNNNEFQKAADELLLSKFSPASVIVNERNEIVYFRGNTSYFLEQSSGKPSHNLFKMAKDGLSFELRSLLNQAKKEKQPVLSEQISVMIYESPQPVTLEIIPLTGTNEPHYLLLFHLSFHFMESGMKKGKPLSNDEKDLRIQQLEKELAQSRYEMRTITEEQDVNSYELQSTYKELLNSSEELQSLNEELETGKEELQSTNEELTVVNNELIALNEQMTAERNFSETVIDNLHEPLIVLDHQLLIKICNSAFYKAFRLSAGDTEGKTIYELSEGQWDIPEMRNLLHNINRNSSKFIKFEVAHHFSKIGDKILLLNASSIYRQNSAEKMILIAIEDITESKIAAQKLIDKNEELQKMNTELRSFSYIASHDLQEPLRKIQTFCSRLHERESNHISDASKGYIARMQNAAQRMQNLIEDLLAFSRVSTTDRQFEQTNLNEILNDVKSDLKEELGNADIKAGKMGTLDIIPFQFKQLLHNLIGNSVKFAKTGTRLLIRIKSKMGFGRQFNPALLPAVKYCHIQISDNGIGFDERFNKKIFEIFQRLHRSDEFTGTGIGLAIVKKIVEYHHGIITANGELDKGATFDIYIPTQLSKLL